MARLKYTVVKNSAVWLPVFSIFENPCSAQRQDCENDGEILNDDIGTDTNCEFVNFCSSWLIAVALSSCVKGGITEDNDNYLKLSLCQF